MKNLLEELYYKRFHLQNGSVKRQKKLRELSALIEKNESDLKARLNDEEQELLEKYLSNTRELHSLENSGEFISGFRLGSRIVMEVVFGADDSELTD